VRIIDLLKDWDEDNSGKIERAEFRKAMATLGIGREQRAAVDKLFDSFDGDRSGEIDHGELQKVLRERVALDEALLPGAMGEIAVEAKNAIELRHGASARHRAWLDGARLDPSSKVPMQVQQSNDVLLPLTHPGLPGAHPLWAVGRGSPCAAPRERRSSCSTSCGRTRCG
jgi:hypothetical protein